MWIENIRLPPPPPLLYLGGNVNENNPDDGGQAHRFKVECVQLQVESVPC